MAAVGDDHGTEADSRYGQGGLPAELDAVEKRRQRRQQDTEKTQYRNPHSGGKNQQREADPDGDVSDHDG